MPKNPQDPESKATSSEHPQHTAVSGTTAVPDSNYYDLKNKSEQASVSGTTAVPDSNYYDLKNKSGQASVSGTTAVPDSNYYDLKDKDKDASGVVPPVQKDRK